MTGAANRLDCKHTTEGRMAKNKDGGEKRNMDLSADIARKAEVIKASGIRGRKTMTEIIEEAARQKIDQWFRQATERHHEEIGGES